MKKTATFLLALGLSSCFAPKATIVAEAQVNGAPVNAAPKKSKATQTELADLSPEAIKPTPLPGRRDGLRLPQDMLALPQDEQLRSAPEAPKDGKATVIARPPEE